MATSAISICNLALAECGNKRITSIDDPVNEARTCKTFYEQTRDEILRSHPWNFACARSTLTQLAEAPAFGWAYQYQLPSDFLRIVALNNVDCDYGDGGQTEFWKIEGGKLLTNEDAANVRYVSRVTNEALFDPLFVKAFSTLLASKIATNITGDRSLGPQLLARYENVDGPRARRIDAGEASPSPKLPGTDSGWVQSRYQRFY